MNTANLQLEGLYLAIASLTGALVAKGLLTREEVEAALTSAEQAANSDYRVADGLSAANRAAVAFPARFLRMANNGSESAETRSFSDLARMVGELDHPVAATADEPDSDGEAFYRSQNGDKWLLVTDTGGRRFVRHVPNRSSGGIAELTNLESFLLREPHSPQNQALAKMVS